MSSEIWYRLVSDSFACSLFQRQYFRFLFYFTASGAKYRVAAVKCLPVLHHSADLISFGIIELILVTLKIEYRLSRCWGRGGVGGGRAYTAWQITLLYMKNHNKSESLILVLLYVLCFQR